MLASDPAVAPLTMPSMKASYRPEIDGLRTVAVLGVVFFHFGFDTVSGGFAGVDVFFVISGYLISRNILNDIARGRFSFFDFYARRMRRILPALIFTVALTFVAGLLWFSPLALRGLAKESTHALLSIANIQYWREFKEYFAPSSESLALLHCWSLSLEEQFYLVWPAFLLLATRTGRSLALIVIACALSLAAALYWQPTDPQAVFFLMPFRIFEFAIGAALVGVETKWLRSQITNEVCSLIGLILILGTFVRLDSASPFVAVTLLPSLGAALIILGGATPFAARGLIVAPSLAIGRASYSLYLCHWPIIVFGRLIFGDAAEQPVAVALSFALMIGLAFLMQRFIEQPFRYVGATHHAKRTLLRFSTLIVACVIITHTTFRADGLTWRLTEAQQVEDALLRSGATPCGKADEGRCAFGDLDGPLRLEVIGDSYATHYMAGLDHLLKPLGLRGEISKLEGCPVLAGLPVPPKSWHPEKCRTNSARELARLGQSTSQVIISHNWHSYSDTVFGPDGPRTGEAYTLIEAALEKTIETLSKPGRSFLVIGAQVMANQCTFSNERLAPAPLPHAPPPPCPPKPREQALHDGATINAALARVVAKFPDRAQLLIPADIFCDETCATVKNGTWLYLDVGHFNVVGSRYAITRAQPMLVDLLRN